MKKIVFALLASMLVAWGVAQDGNATSGPVTTDLLDAMTLERDLGNVTFEAGSDGGVVATFAVDANDVIASGEHAIHIHENGACGFGDTDDDGEPDAAGAAGGHFNPTDVGHGEDDGPHVGDSAEYNYAFGGDGGFSGEVVFPLASLDGENGVVGRAIIVHEGTDDMETNPGGQAGPRVACAVISAPD